MSANQSTWFLEERPSSRLRFFYQAIILSLSLHVFALGVVYLVNSSAPPSPETDIAVVKELELRFEEPAPEEYNPPQGMSEALRNLVANRNAERTDEQVSFRGKSKETIEREVWEALKGMEKAEFERLKEKHPEMKESWEDVQSAVKKESGEQQEQGGDKSFAGQVAAEYDLPGRMHKFKKMPTYRCKGSGVVVVLIEVNQEGTVVSATVNENTSSPNECLRTESVNYARLWKFDYKPDAQKKQPGSITFTFSSQ